MIMMIRNYDLMVWSDWAGEVSSLSAVGVLSNNTILLLQSITCGRGDHYSWLQINRALISFSFVHQGQQWAWQNLIFEKSSKNEVVLI